MGLSEYKSIAGLDLKLRGQPSRCPLSIHLSLMALTNQTSSLPQCLSPGDSIYLHWLYPSPQYPVYYTPAPKLVSSISDQTLALIAPIIAYWVYAVFFHKLDTAEWTWPEKFRIHPAEEEKARYIATPSQVFWAVVLQQVLRTLLGIWWLSSEEPGIP